MNKLRPLVMILVLAGACDHTEVVQVPSAVLEVLEGTDEFELLSLNPDRKTDEGPAKDDFHEWQVLGKTTVKDAKTRKQLIDALKQGVKQNLEMGKQIAVGEPMFAECFNPRHGLKATHDGKTVELVICFECFRVYAYFDGPKLEHMIPTTGRQQPVFDAILKKASVPLPPQKES